MNPSVADGGTGGGEPMKHRLLAFLRITQKPGIRPYIPVQRLFHLAGHISRNFQNEVMFESLAIGKHSLGQRFGQKIGEPLKQTVCKIIWKERGFRQPRIHHSLEREEGRKAVRSPPVDHQQRVLAISPGHVKAIPMQVFATDRKLGKLRQQTAPQPRQRGGVIGADIIDARIGIDRKRV
ncbi:hypothetical protein D3C73_620800 [compost metagenome]